MTNLTAMAAKERIADFLGQATAERLRRTARYAPRSRRAYRLSSACVRQLSVFKNTLRRLVFQEGDDS
jgi:hypothetical protein